MQRMLIIVLALLASMLSSQAQETDGWSGAWEMDRGASRLEFRSAMSGDEFTGAFQDFDVEIVLDPDNLEEARIVATVATASARTGDRQKDKAMPGGDWFDSRTHETAVFEADDIVETGKGAYEARGTLSLRGVEQPFVLPFTLDIDGDRARAAGEATIIRTEFGVGRGEFADGKWVDVEVGVAVTIEATRGE